MITMKQRFDWSQELNQLITKSLVTQFGLDFLLLEDKKGGNVDTIHNVRQGIWATKSEKQRYEQRESYDSHAYHRHENYIDKGRRDKAAQQQGTLKDHYRTDKNLSYGENRDLDHVKSAYEIHHDAGRILAEKNGVELANQDSNLCSTTSSINRTKKQHSIPEFLEKLPQTIKNREVELIDLNKKLKQMPRNTAQQKHERQKVQDQIDKKQQSLEQLKQVDPDEMRKIDQAARHSYDQQINQSYYTSSKFFKNSIDAAMKTGFKMGLRESIGLIFAEIWFELKQQIPSLQAKYSKIEFKISEFFLELKQIILNIFERVKLRFKDIVNSFKDGIISGILSNITMTIVNIFLTTTKFWGRVIREAGSNLINIVKLVFFNPDNLSTGELTKATFKLLSASIGVIAGILIHQNLVVVEALPFGGEIRVFLTALSTGIITLALNYFIEQSPIMLKLWKFLDQFKSKDEKILDYYKEINAELNRYLLELNQLEFNINIDDLEKFAHNLKSANTEMERHAILKQQVEKEDIKLPFEMGNSDSVRNWLLAKARK